jgi:predicted NAD/FAD-binding protein
MKIPVVGARVSGLVAAHRLASAHDATVFEAASYAGGHTNTVRVDTPNETHWVDTGFIVFNDRNYPRFERLLDTLKVPRQPSDMSFAVTDTRGDFEYASTSPNGLFAKRAHLATPWFHGMLADLVRFQRQARKLLSSEHSYSRVRGPADRPPGGRRVVRRPAPDVELPRALPDRVLRQPRDARASTTS